MIRRLTVDPALPITTADAKKALRIDHGFEDAILLRKLTAAVELVEERTSRYLRPVELEVTFDAWPCYRTPELDLGVWPVRDVTAVEYFPETGSARTVVGPALYDWRRTETGAELYFLSGFSAPSISTERRGPVRLIVEAGYDTAAEPGEDAELQCPARVIELVLLLAGHWMKNREATTSGNLADVPYSAGLLFKELRNFR